MKYKKTLLVALTVVFASCGGGGGVAVINNVADVATYLSNGFMLVPAAY